MTRKDVVAQHHSHRFIADKVGTNDKGLCQSIRRRLNSIGQVHTKLVSITQQVLKSRCILRCGDNQNVTDACVHQDRHRIINHRFVIDWQELFTCYLCQWIKACAWTTCQNNALHQLSLWWVKYRAQPEAINPWKHASHNAPWQAETSWGEKVKPRKPAWIQAFFWLSILFHRFHTGSVFSAIGSISPALTSGFPNLILCCFCTTITPDDLSPRVSHPRDLILRSFSARKYRCFSVLPLTKSILISPNRNSGDFVLWVTFRYQLSTNFSLLLSVLF